MTDVLLVTLRTGIDPTMCDTGWRRRTKPKYAILGVSMSKRARKRRDRKKTGPNHGKRPNS
jgi:hypothetical protein